MKQPVSVDVLGVRVARCCSAAAMVVSVVALGAWLTGRWSLLALGTGQKPMAPSTAAILALASSAIWLSAPGRRSVDRFGRFAAWAVLVGGAVCWAGHALHLRELEVHWLTRSADPVGALRASRVSVATAPTLVVLGFVLLLRRPASAGRPGRPTAAGLLSLAMLLVGLAVLLADCAGAPYVAGSRAVAMALPTAVVFVLLGLALLLGDGQEAWLLQLLLGRPATPVPLAFDSRSLLLVLALAGSLLGSGMWYLRARRIATQRTKLQELRTIVDLKAEQVATWHADQVEDALAVFGTPAMARDGASVVAGTADERLARATRSWLERLRTDRHYLSVALFDAAGEVRLASPDTMPRAGPHERIEIAAVAQSSQMLVTDLHRGDVTGRVFFTVLVPLGGATAGGVARCQIDLARTFFPMIQTWPTPSPTGEVMLVRRDGDEVLYLNELRHRTDTALRLRRPVDQPNLPGALAIQGRPLVSAGIDYRDVPVMAASTPVAGTSWHLVAKIDQAEVYAPLRREALTVGGILAALLLGVAVSLSNLWRQRLAGLLSQQLAAEIERRTLAEQSALIMRHANDIILVANEQGVLIEANDRAVESYGYPLAELLGRPIATLRPVTARDELAAQLATATADGRVVYETVHQHRDGRTFPVEVSLSVYDASGTPQQLAVIRDISERKQAEVALRQAQAELAQFFELVPDMVCVASANGYFQLLNPAWTAALGYSLAELRSRPFTDFIHPDDLAHTAAEIERQLAGRQTVAFVNRYRHRDGSYRWLEWQATPAIDGLLFAAARDITERREAEEALAAESRRVTELLAQAEAGRRALVGVLEDHQLIEVALRENQHQFQALFEQAGDYALVLEAQSAGPPVIAEANVAACLAHGLSRAELIGQPVTVLDASELSDQDMQRYVERARAGETVQFETVHRRADGSTFPVEVTAKAVRLADQRSLIFSVERDLTERHLAEQAHQELQAQLAQAQKMEAVGRLAGGIAHDFNNMLGVILGNAEFALRRLAPGEPGHADLQEIVEAGQRSAQLTRQLLTFARRQPISPRVVDLNRVITDALVMLRRLIGEHIKLTWQPGPELWPVRADPAQLGQVLTNLCVNARDALLAGGEITIQTQNVDCDELTLHRYPWCAPGPYVQLVVRDTGCGMDPATLGRIFEPFFTTKDVGQGTGLGLAMVYGAVQQNGGFIDVDSTPGQGTTFALHLARDRSAAEPVPPARQAPEDLTGDETILVVEDEPLVLNMIRKSLQALGYHVLEATLGSEALRVADEFAGEIHVLLTDVVMPEMNGRDLAAQLVSSRPALRCLLMSGYSTEVLADQTVPIIEKPFTAVDLATRVRSVLAG